MNILAIVAVAAVLQGGWTWTLYEGDGPLVLANEVPDTPQLRATLQCDAGSGIARLDLYGGQQGAGYATLTSGSASATGQMSAGNDRRSIALRTDHPVFGQFMLNGALDVGLGDQHQTIDVQTEHLAKLRRFAELCAG